MTQKSWLVCDMKRNTWLSSHPRSFRVDFLGESRSKIILFPQNGIYQISIIYLFGWSKPAKGSKHALAAKLETVAHCMWRIVLSTDFNRHNSAPASGSKRELNKFSLFTCNLEIISDHLRSSQIPSWPKYRNMLKSMQIT